MGFYDHELSWGLEEARQKGRREREREITFTFLFFFLFLCFHMPFSEQKYGAHKDHVIKLTENLTVLV
ncbi:hypothetical protein DVH24_016990 [Malus domestica]|uniref:Uncharacterized protein n=1 Tax=Malus domestica TaxID=3750 RepID=A0A498IUV8_MALDO|nr:hypothetical protein DVH24_016990 [Malus domestica]